MRKRIQMKMLKFKKEDLLGPSFDSMNVLVVSAFFFMVGISAGIFLELMINPDAKEGISQYLLRFFETGTSEVSFPNPFVSSLINNFLLLLVIFVAGLTIYLFPAALLTLFFKGLILGFSSCLIIGTFSLKGVFYILHSIIPQNILLIPAFIFAASSCINYALARISRKQKELYPVRKSSSKAMSFYLYCVSFIIPAAMIFLGCLIEGLLFLIVF